MKKSKQIKQIQAEIESLRKQVAEGNFANNKIKDLEERLEKLNSPCCCCKSPKSMHEIILKKYLPGVEIVDRGDEYADIVIVHSMTDHLCGDDIKLVNVQLKRDIWEFAFICCVFWKSNLINLGTMTNRTDPNNVYDFMKLRKYLEHYLVHLETPDIEVLTNYPNNIPSIHNVEYWRKRSQE